MSYICVLGKLHLTVCIPGRILSPVQSDQGSVKPWHVFGVSWKKICSARQPPQTEGPSKTAEVTLQKPAILLERHCKTKENINLEQIGHMPCNHLSDLGMVVVSKE